MVWHQSRRLQFIRKHVANWLLHPACLGSLPGISLCLFWLMGEPALVAAAIIFPLCYLLIGLDAYPMASRAVTRAAAAGVLQRDAFEELVNQYFHISREKGLRSVCLIGRPGYCKRFFATFFFFLGRAQ